MINKKIENPFLSDLHERTEEPRNTRFESSLSEIEDIKGLLSRLWVNQVDLESRNEKLREACTTIAESQRSHFELYNQAPVAYFTLDPYGAIETVNITGTEILKLPCDSMVGKPFASFVAPDFQDEFSKHRDHVLAAKTKHTCDLKIMDCKGDRFYVQADSIAMLDSAGNVRKIGMTITDVNVRVLCEELLRKKLDEKDVLLREIHHRIKNNMQVIISLLNLQAKRVKDPELRDVFRDSQNRVRSMAMIHEALYKTNELSGINLKPYLKNLAAELLRTYKTSPVRVSLNVNGEDVFLDLERAIPCGLVVNELIANSLKYAFPDGREGKINVHVRLNDTGHAVLVVGDNGVGLPHDFDVRKTNTLGLSLAANLMENQLGGKMEIERAHGLQYTFTFKPTMGR
jgi:PAS domain S-box-containing protein